MKRLFLFFILICCLLQIPVSSMAQNTLKCGEGPVELTILLVPPICFPKAQFPDSMAAYDGLIFHLDEIVDCNEENCPPGRQIGCKPIFNGFSIFPTLNCVGNKWCFSGLTTFSWSCTDCVIVDPKEFPGTGPTGGPGPSGGAGTFNSGAYTFEELPSSTNTSPVAQLKNMYPNPSSGVFYLDLILKVPDNQVLIKTSDLTGKVVQETEFKEVPKSLFQAQTDLSAQSNGLYLMSIYVNQELIETKKIKVQK